MLDETMFPRWVFRPGETRLAESKGDYDQALANGWFDTVGEANEAPEAKATEPEPEAQPTRSELEAKATELGLKFDGRTSDKKLADLIAAELEA